MIVVFVVIIMFVSSRKCRVGVCVNIVVFVGRCC